MAARLTHGPPFFLYFLIFHYADAAVQCHVRIYVQLRTRTGTPGAPPDMSALSLPAGYGDHFEPALLYYMYVYVHAAVSSALFCSVFACSDPLRRPGLFRLRLGFEPLGLGIILRFLEAPPILGSRTDDDDASGSY